MKKKDDKSFTIRVDATTLERFRYIAKYEDRTLSKQIRFLIHKCIRDFEAEHGKIEIELPQKDS